VDAWIDIRRKARACHDEALKSSKGDRRAVKLVAAALHNDDLELRQYEPGSIVSAGVLGFLNRAARLVNVAKHQDPADELVVIAHEIGHYRLHRDPQNEVTVRPHGLGGDPIDSGAGRVEGYSPRERKEVQSDIFAGEFLCPSDWLRIEYINHNRRPHEIANELGLPPHLVINQTIRALLLPPIGSAPPPAQAEAHVLDASQETAATWRDGPLLVDAGPGTGKTRTLVRRIKYLLENGALSGSILALTFSVKASEEMRERLSAMDADAAIEMWVGFFIPSAWSWSPNGRRGSTAPPRCASSIKPARSAFSKTISRNFRFAITRTSTNQPTSWFMFSARSRAVRTNSYLRLRIAPPRNPRSRRHGPKMPVWTRKRRLKSQPSMKSMSTSCRRPMRSISAT
jgi:hypothetical protein